MRLGVVGPVHRRRRSNPARRGRRVGRARAPGPRPPRSFLTKPRPDLRRRRVVERRELPCDRGGDQDSGRRAIPVQSHCARSSPSAPAPPRARRAAPPRGALSQPIGPREVVLHRAHLPLVVLDRVRVAGLQSLGWSDRRRLCEQLPEAHQAREQIALRGHPRAVEKAPQRGVAGRSPGRGGADQGLSETPAGAARAGPSDVHDGRADRAGAEVEQPRRRIVPVGSIAPTRMLPGCTSPWARPCSRCNRRAPRRGGRPRAGPFAPAAADRRVHAMRPSTYSESSPRAGALSAATEVIERHQRGVAHPA